MNLWLIELSKISKNDQIWNFTFSPYLSDSAIMWRASFSIECYYYRIKSQETYPFARIGLVHHVMALSDKYGGKSNFQIWPFFGIFESSMSHKFMTPVFLFIIYINE